MYSFKLFLETQDTKLWVLLGAEARNRKGVCDLCFKKCVI